MGIAALPLVDAVGNEARLWSQEADLYRRRAGESLAGILPKPPPAKPPSSIVSIDAEFASALLAAVRSAAGQDARVVDEVARSLRIQELPFFKEAGTCGHCGTKSGPSALSDRDYFDFEAYIRCKALLDLCPVPAGPPPPAIEGTDEASAPVSAASGPADASRAECLTSLRAEMGDAILHHILDEVDVGGAEAAGIAPTRPILNDALLSASAELDSIRKGVQALLKYFRKKGEAAVQVPSHHAVWAACCRWEGCVLMKKGWFILGFGGCY